jgi:hypothetical protein
MLARPSGSEAAILALRSSGHKLKEAVESALGNLGKLAAMFESGDEGGSAIGYDRMGGTSYGKYQISSKAGTMDEFIAFLHKKAPHLAKELKAAGPANTGGRKGKMPETWRDISSRDPQGFEKLQHEFVHERLYLPTLRRLKGQGLDESDFSPVMREVLFSTAVQHGPTGAARIMGRAMEKSGGALSAAAWGDKGASAVKGEEVLIKRIYSLRQGQFGSSASHVQKAVSGRLQNEMNTALRMLKTGAMLVG